MKGFSISKREDVKQNISRILLGQIDYILHHCEGNEADIHISIHEIRKSIKRIRAVLRLIREEIGYSTYYRENVFFRDISRKISGLRTHNVLALTLENLKGDLSPAFPQEAIDSLIKTIRSEREEMLARITADGKALKRLAVSFEKARERIPGLPIQGKGFEVFAGGMQRVYRQGRKYLGLSRETPDVHLLHDMRKRVKYLWYQVEIIKPVYPVMLKAYADSLEDVSESLGIYHDLAVMVEYLEDDPTRLDQDLQETLLEACEFKKSALLPGIFKTAGAAYGEEPEALIQRLGEYWKVHYHRDK
jgi:CHAD domain-containing protein